MRASSTGRRSSSNPVRVSMFDREDKNVQRNDQRRTQTTKPKGMAGGETSHIPRPRFRSSSSDRASGRISYLKVPGKSQLCQPMTPVTPARASSKPNLAVGLSTGRSPSAERASSFGARGPRKDTRPLTDKSYQTALLNKIDDFFHVNQRSSMLNSNGSLKPITLKMFVEVSSFLLKLFELKQELTITNYVEELPRCAKKLHYPGMVTKSWLKTANAMHSWPNVLGWIGWLVEASKVRDLAFDRYQMETLPFVGTEQQAQSSSTEFSAILHCYKAWNDETFDEEAELLERYLQDVEIQQGITEEDVAHAHKELEKETTKLQAMEEDLRKVDEEVERKKGILLSLQAKETKRLKDIKEKKERIKNTSAEVKKLNAEYTTFKGQIRVGNKKSEELNGMIRDQPMSKTEKERIVKKCTEIQNYTHQFDEHLKDYQKELYTLDIKLAALNNSLNKAVLVYNKEIFIHIDNDVDVNLDELKFPEKGLFDPQIMEVLEEKATLLKTFKESLTNQCNAIGFLISSDTTELEILKERFKSVPDDKKLKEERSDVDKKKINLKKEKAKLMEQIEALESEIKEIQDMIPDIQMVELQVEEAKEKFDAVARRGTFLEQSAERFFDELYRNLGEHRNKLHDLLTKKV